MDIRKADVSIVGSGIAGLIAAYLLSSEKKVILITKGKLEHSNSILAQGGIATAIASDDHWNDHFQDTIVAGNYHNIESATKTLVQNGPKIIKQLIELNVPFDRNNDHTLSLGREGGHLKRRIVHAGGDATGKEIIQQLIAQVKSRVEIYQEEQAIDLVTNDNRNIGIITRSKNNRLIFNQAEHTILATGGIGGLYSVTSNDKTITGDGMAMAYRAGADLTDLEFIQFHPTMLVQNGITYGLVSEAVRGEGAKLIDEDGNFIMKDIHPLKDLAPRDIVARQIYHTIERNKKVFLDISMIKDFRKRFPTITAICDKANIDIDKGFLPIAPGAHFIMGGIHTNLFGQTTIPGLYAIGEVAHTGVHGANRLASNSLLEGAVFANQLSDYIKNRPSSKSKGFAPSFLVEKKQFQDLPLLSEIQKVMVKYVGIVRHEPGLITAKNWFEGYLSKTRYNSLLHFSSEELTRLNMLTVGCLITTSALERTESRGGHFRLDYPMPCDEKWRQHFIIQRRDKDERNQTKPVASAII